MTSFTDVSRLVHTINDLILSDTKYEPDTNAAETVNFGKHLLATKHWFSRISYVNKKRYLLVLLQDVRSAWTLSLLLKSIWNCRPKDAVLSVSERRCCLSSYDQVPMDHNRTALPVNILAQAMKNDRIWFRTLGPETQAQVLTELLTIAGGPAMWEVLSRAQTLYERYYDNLLQNLREYVVVSDGKGGGKEPPPSKDPPPSAATETLKPDAVHTTPEAAATPSQAQKNLDANLATWNATLKAMRDSLKLEELEMTFHDGTQRKVWKVNRMRPDTMETVDFVQLLPSSVGKRILSFLPKAQLADFARVNKYWAYLIEEYRNEVAARTKLDADIEKLQNHISKYDESMYFMANKDPENPVLSNTESEGQLGAQKLHYQPSVRPSEKSAAYSLRFFSDKLMEPEIAPKPIRNMADLNERLERRGATDENIWKWCKKVVSITKKPKEEKKDLKKRVLKPIRKPQKAEETDYGVLKLPNVHFPCPLMKHIISVPLTSPLYKDPSEVKSSTKPKRLLTDATLDDTPTTSVRRLSLWTRNVSSLYPVVKIPSYQFPFPLV